MKERIIFLLLLGAFGLAAQNYSPYALLYKPSIEALKIYVDGGAYDPAFLANVQTEKPIDTLWKASDTNRLPEARGVYMLVYTAGGELKFSLVNQKPWEVLVTHRNGKVAFKVFDPDAQAFVHDVTVVESAKGNLYYSEEKDAYTFKKWFYKYGDVLVYRNGEATLAEWDAFADEYYDRPAHFKYRLETFWLKLTDREYRKSDKLYKRYAKGMNYIATNKPKYRVGDTVVVKAYLLKKNGKPYRKHAQFVLSYSDYQKHKGDVNQVLDTLAPYRPGAYRYTFVAPDSLLGKSIQLALKNKKGQILLMHEVDIEEYTLNRIAFEAELVKEQNTYYPNEPIRIKYSAMDDLGLSAMEGRIEVSVKCTSLSLPMTKPIIMLPFSLIDTTFQLDVTGRGIYSLPIGKLPPSPGRLNITITYVSADGETESKYFSPSWSSSPKRVHLRQQNGFWVVVADSAFNPEGKTIEMVTTRYFEPEDGVYLRRNEYAEREKIRLPYTFRKGLPHDWRIEIDGDLALEPTDENTRNNNFYAWQVSPEVVKIYPEGGTLRLRYAEIYEDGKKLVFSGFLPNDTLILPATSDYYAFFQTDFNAEYFALRPDFIWVNPKLKGGADFLRLTAEGPKRIYPGDTATWKLNLDEAGKPVDNFDILALAYKEKQFENSGTRQPALRKSVRYPHVKTGKLKSNDVSKGDAMPQPNRETLTKAWLQQLGADTLNAYKYMFSPGGVLVNQVPLPDGLTRPQFAAFVYNGGVQYAVQAFYVAGEVKHIRKITKWNYSSEVDAGLAEVQIRLRDMLLTVPNVRMLPGHKTELALDLANLPDSIAVRKMPSKYTDDELKHFSEHILHFECQNNYTVSQGNARSFQTGRDKEFSGPFAHDTIRFSSGNVILNFGFRGNIKYSLNSVEMVLEKEPFHNLKLKMGYNYMFSHEKYQIPGEFLQLPKAEDLPQKVSHQFSVVERPTSSAMSGGRVEFQGFWSKESRFVYNYTSKELYAVDYNDLRYNSYWQPAQYALIILSNEYAFLIDSFDIKSQYTTFIDVTEGKLISVDSALVLIKRFSDIAEQQLKMAALSYSSVEVGATTYVGGNASAMKGSVIDKVTGETIPFASIVLKQDGVVVREGTTDMDGNFFINPIVPGTYTAECGFLGYATILLHDIVLKAGEHRSLNFSLTTSSDMLNEIVITASEPRVWVGGTFESITLEEVKNLPYRNIGQVAASTPGVYQFSEGNAINIRGARGNGDVTFIDGVKVRVDSNIPRDAIAYDMSYLSGLPAQYGDVTGGAVQFDANGNSIGGSTETLATLGSRGGNVRKNFRDYAFFIPNITTDKSGKASFSITYPDDAANWQTYFIGMGKGNQYAYAQTNTLAYSEVSASLATPRYLLQGDSCVLIGKSMNYLDTSLRVHYQFIANGDTVLHEKGKLRDVLLHRVPVVAKDVLHATYSVQLQNGFIDGEERSVPILPVGLQKSEGTFWVLEGDTSVTFTAAAEGLIRLGVMRTTTDFLLEEVDLQLRYYHSCNEQLASKLRAILAIQTIDAAADRRQRDGHEARKIIKQLLDSRNESGLWGWWANQETNAWMTPYVLESLLQAERMGYEVKMPNTLGEVFKDLPFQNTTERLNSLFALSTAGIETNYAFYIGKMKMDSLSISGKLKFALIAEYIGFAYDTAAVDALFEKDMLGNTYVPGDGAYNLAGIFYNTLLGSYWLNSQMRNSESTSCLNYMLLARRNGELNTIERAALIELLGQNLVELSTEKSTLTVLWGNGERQEMEDNRAIITRKGQSVTVQKTGSGIAFASATVSRFEPEPKPKATDFMVQTTLRNADATKTGISVGEKAILEVNIDAKAEARYVMLEIPIPASCTVVEQPFRSYRFGPYQEVKGDKVHVYLDRLAGNFKWQIELLPRYAGAFTMNPAKAELMYFPTKNGNNEVKRVEVVN